MEMVTVEGKEQVKSITDYFLASSYREGQKEALLEVEKAFNEGFKYVILEAPTGLGKSFIAGAFARRSSSCHILTVQKILQDQYGRDFKNDMFVMKGRGAYICNKSKDLSRSTSCAEGPCMLEKRKVVHEDCPYKVALAVAKASQTVVHNFDSFYYQTMYAKAFFKRELMIVDEAHNIENKFLNFIGFTISNRKHHFTIPEFDTTFKYTGFLKEQLEIAQTRVSTLSDMEILTVSELAELSDLKRLATKIELYLKSAEKGVSYIHQFKDFKGWQTVSFNPVLVGSFVKDFLFPKADKVLLMSATILDKRIFCESIGLDPNEVAHVVAESHFPVENRPIYYSGFAGSMSYKTIDETLPKLVNRIRDIMNKHPNERGIIHTVSEKIATYIKNNLRDSRLTFRKDFNTVPDMLIFHEQKKNSFIVASGLKEGVDLKDDLSRVQIICKIPYPSLGDKRVKKRMNMDRKWYGYVTVFMFVQSLGRSVRSSKDSAVTYILDSDFKKFYGMNKQFIPKYIKQAFVKE